jgi:hypothetical protein
VREDVKVVIANSSQDAPCHLRRVHAGADPFGKPSIVRVRRVYWCRRATTLGRSRSLIPQSEKNFSPSVNCLILLNRFLKDAA